MPSRKKSVFVDNPASTEYLVLDAGGRVLDRQADLLLALAHGKMMLNALCVIGAPSGVLLARCIHGSYGDDNKAVRAVRRWSQSSTHPSTTKRPLTTPRPADAAHAQPDAP